MILKSKTLLIISNGYPSKDKNYNSEFVKGQIDSLSKYFKEIIVISPKPYLPSFFKYFKFLPKNYLEKFNFYDYKYKNISVYYPNYLLLPFKFFKKYIGDFAYLSTLNLIKKKNFHFDLIHSHFIWKSGFIGSKLKLNFGTKFIVTGHGSDVYNYPFLSKENLKIFKFVINSCDYFITVSNKNLIVAKSIIAKLSNKSKVIFNGFNDSEFKKINKNKCVSKLGLPKDKKILLHIGNYIVDVKNQLNLIRSIKKLTLKRKDFVLYLIGKGKDEMVIKQKIKSLQLQDFIKVIGAKPHDEIAYWMNASDLFLLPSYKEGNPTVMFEALGCGLPYIGTSVGGVPEIINSEDYGLIYDNPNDYKMLCNLINVGLDKRWDFKKITKYSLNFRWCEICTEIINIYKVCLKIKSK